MRPLATPLFSPSEKSFPEPSIPKCERYGCLESVSPEVVVVMLESLLFRGCPRVAAAEWFNTVLIRFGNALFGRIRGKGGIFITFFWLNNYDM